MAARGTGKGRRTSTRKQAQQHVAVLEHGPQATLDDLLERGKEQGYVTEADIDELFADDPEPPDAAQLDAIHQALLDAGVEIVTNESELEQTVDDIQLDQQLDRLESEGEAIQADPVWQYLKDIHDIPLLTAQQEVELA